MPNQPWPTRSRGEPATGDPSLADLLAWAEFPAGSAAEMRPLAEMLAALTAGPAGDELAGEAAALAAYRNRGGVPRAAAGNPRHRRRPLFPFASVRTAATVAAAAAVLSVSAFATAAYTQVLPAPVQQLAHNFIGAPGAGSGPSAPSPAGSGAPGPGGTGGAGGTPTGRARPSPTPHATSRPGSQPTPQGSGEPSTEPTPSGSDTPTPTPSNGKPSTHPTNGNGNGGCNGNGNGNTCPPTVQP
jgi:hypothetical protein